MSGNIRTSLTFSWLIMKKIHIAVENELVQLTNQLIDNQTLPLTIMLFHPEGYRKIASKDMSAMTLGKAYLHESEATCYAIIFDGAYEDPIDGALDCLTCAIVTRDGNARVEHTPYLRQSGTIEFQERRLALTDAPYLHLFDPLDESRYDMKLIHQLLDDVCESGLSEYSDFIIATC